MWMSCIGRSERYVSYPILSYLLVYLMEIMRVWACALSALGYRIEHLEHDDALARGDSGVSWEWEWCKVVLATCDMPVFAWYWWWQEKERKRTRSVLEYVLVLVSLSFRPCVHLSSPFNFDTVSELWHSLNLLSCGKWEYVLAWERQKVQAAYKVKIR